MSLFSWLFRKPTPSRQGAAAPAQRHGRVAGFAPPGVGPVEPSLQPAGDASGRRTERLERRELLYAVVRDAMVRAGVLSAGYKFKVLSLDQRGQRFLAMVDLSRDYGGETVRLSEIEALIVQTAKARFDIEVTAVYWRISDQVPASASGAHSAPAPAPAPTPPLVVVAPVVRPAPVLPPRQVPAPGGGRTEPLEDDEVAEFKRALLRAAASRQSAAAAGAAPAPAPAPAMLPGESVRTGPVGSALSGRTGFEDTELPPQDQRPQELSTTQFGQL